MVQTVWRGNPLPYADTIITSGSNYDTLDAVIPIGVLYLYNFSSAPDSLMLYGGSVLAPGLQVYSYDPTYAFDLTVDGLTPAYSVLNTYAGIDNIGGTFEMNLIGDARVNNFGTIFAGYNTLSQIDLISSPTSFYNYGTMETVSGHLFVDQGARTSFVNIGNIDAIGSNALVFLENGSAMGSSFTNNGFINAGAGGTVEIVTQVYGAGILDASSGGRLYFFGGGNAGSGETVDLNSGVLELNSAISMNFLAPIEGESAGSTILFDNTLATSDIFHVLSQAGAGLSELTLFNGRNEVADLKFIGHFQPADFTLTDHSAASGNWTALTFSNHVNTLYTYHS
jgi:hypothetical protein